MRAHPRRHSSMTAHLTKHHVLTILCVQGTIQCFAWMLTCSTSPRCADTIIMTLQMHEHTDQYGTGTIVNSAVDQRPCPSGCAISGWASAQWRCRVHHRLTTCGGWWPRVQISQLPSRDPSQAITMPRQPSRDQPMPQHGITKMVLSGRACTGSSGPSTAG